MRQFIVSLVVIAAAMLVAVSGSAIVASGPVWP